MNSKKARKVLPRDLHKSGRQTLETLDSAQRIQDLKKIPGSHYEELKGEDLESIRINRQYRVLFNWTDSGPVEVEISKHYE